MLYRTALVAAVSATLLSGCATIIEGTTQKVSVSTKPEGGAICTLANERGKWTVTSPGTVEVKRSTTDLVVTCTKDGWQDTTGTLHSRTTDGTSATALLWGPIGVGIDAATGATFVYPPVIDLPMTPVAAPPAVTSAVTTATPAATPAGPATPASPAH